MEKKEGITQEFLRLRIDVEWTPAGWIASTPQYSQFQASIASSPQLAAAVLLAVISDQLIVEHNLANNTEASS